MAEATVAIARELEILEAELKRLEAEYNMYFAGRLQRPPWETRARVATFVKRLDRMHMSNYGERFRFNALQARHSAFIDLWDRALRAREEGRIGPFASAPTPPRAAREAPKTVQNGVVAVATFTDPMREMDKLQDLYERLAEARRDVGQEAIPFHKFAALIRTQVDAFKDKGNDEVAFRVAMKDGKVAFTARAMRGSGESDQ